MTILLSMAHRDQIWVLHCQIAPMQLIMLDSHHYSLNVEAEAARRMRKIQSYIVEEMAISMQLMRVPIVDHTLFNLIKLAQSGHLRIGLKR